MLSRQTQITCFPSLTSRFSSTHDYTHSTQPSLTRLHFDTRVSRAIPTLFSHHSPLSFSFPPLRHTCFPLLSRHSHHSPLSFSSPLLLHPFTPPLHYSSQIFPFLFLTLMHIPATKVCTCLSPHRISCFQKWLNFPKYLTHLRTLMTLLLTFSLALSQQDVITE